MEWNVTIGSGDVFRTKTSAVLVIDQSTFAFVVLTSLTTGGRSNVFAEWSRIVRSAKAETIARVIQDDTRRTVAARRERTERPLRIFTQATRVARLTKTLTIDTRQWHTRT